jgi:hypothetical protein
VSKADGMTLTVARWTIEYDANATRQCFAALPVGSGCDCAYCRNYLAALDHIFPSEFRALADQLGIDLAKPAELAHYCREEAGLLTSGWFHLVGTILSGDDAWHWVENYARPRFETLAPGFQFGFDRRLSLVPEPFKTGPAVQIEFLTHIPWSLAEPEPVDEQPDPESDPLAGVR